MLEKMEAFDLKDVPADLVWCIYEGERKQGKVFCNSTAYKVVLALRWLLSYTGSASYDDGYDQIGTYKVYWKAEDDYGFRTRIYLSRDQLKGYNADGEWETIQEPVYVSLATLVTRNCNNAVEEVHMLGAQPYGGRFELDGKSGVQRLLDDAAHGSGITGCRQPIQRSKHKMIHLLIVAPLSTTASNLFFASAPWVPSRGASYLQGASKSFYGLDDTGIVYFAIRHTFLRCPILGIGLLCVG